ADASGSGGSHPTPVAPPLPPVAPPSQAGQKKPRLAGTSKNGKCPPFFPGAVFNHAVVAGPFVVDRAQSTRPSNTHSTITQFLHGWRKFLIVSAEQTCNSSSLTGVAMSRRNSSK